MRPGVCNLRQFTPIYINLRLLGVEIAKMMEQIGKKQEDKYRNTHTAHMAVGHRPPTSVGTIMGCACGCFFIVVVLLHI